MTAKKKTPTDYHITEEDMREVGRVAFGIVYPGDLDRPRKKPSPVTRKANSPLGTVIIDEKNTVIVGHSIIGTAVADGVKNVMVIETEDLNTLFLPVEKHESETH